MKTEINSTVKKEKGAAFRAAFPYTIPVLTGYLALGFAYGVLLQSKGYGVGWAVLMSVAVFGGSIQYIAVDLLSIPFDPLQAFLMSILVNARHIFYGLSMLQKYKGLGKKRPLLIFWLTDETFSLNSSIEVPENIDRGKFYFWVSLLDYSYWIMGGFLGSIAGELIHFNTEGMDFVLTALFVVLFLEQWKVKEHRLACIIGLVCTFASRMIFGAGNLVIPAMVFIMICLLAIRKPMEKKLMPATKEESGVDE